MLVVYDSNAKPWYLSRRAYWILSLLTCSWLMRLFVRTRIATVHYTIHKVFGHNYNSRPMPSAVSRIADGTSIRTEMMIDEEPSHYNDEDDVRLLRPLANAIAMDSCDEDVNVKSASSSRQCVIVPSYSQALLMDCYTKDNRRVRSSSSAMKRVRSCVSFTLGRNRSIPSAADLNGDQTTTISKSQSFTCRRLLLPVNGDVNGCNTRPQFVACRRPVRPMSFAGNLMAQSNVVDERTALIARQASDELQSPPPSYDTALSMLPFSADSIPLQHTVVLQRHRDRGAEVLVHCSPSQISAATCRIASQRTTITVMETCL